MQVVASLPWDIDAPPAPSDIQLVTGFDSAPPLSISKVSNAHFAIDFKGEFCNWFMFRVEGAKGHTVRIDLRSVPLNKWSTLNPVYSTVASVDALDAFAITDLEQWPEDYESQARNGPKLPDTSGQKWHFIENVWSENKSDLCFELKMPEDRVWIAMRYPYTPGYHEAYMASIGSHPNVEVIEIGRSESGRPLHVVKVSGGEEAERRNPCIVMYAREHATEQDASWLVQGAIQAVVAAEYDLNPQNVTFLLIPMLDPDGAAAADFDRVTESFTDANRLPTSEAFGTFFKDWIVSGKRLDVVLNIHNVESREAHMLECAQYEPAGERENLCRVFNEDFVVEDVRQAGYRMESNVGLRGSSNFRLGGYLRRMYGVLHMPYEVNVQSRDRHLALEEVRTLGGVVLFSATRFLSSTSGQQLSGNVSEHQRTRVEKWERYQPMRETLKRLQHNGISEEEWLDCFE